MSKRICIDPGHGGKDSGAVYGTRYEKNDNLRFAQALEKSLERQGFDVFLTRTKDVDMSLPSRTNYAKSVKADCLISIHRNSFINSLAKGVENWVYTTANSSTVSFATLIQNEIVKVGVQANRGVKKGNYHMCREVNVPACLLELGFIKNPEDNRLYDTNFDEYVEAITKGICRFYVMTYKPPVVKSKLGKWCIGAFNEQTKGREDVKVHLDALRKIGYGVWYEEEK